MRKIRSFANGNGAITAGVPGKQPDQSVIDAKAVTTTFYELV
jgi:hypothetical protein